MKRVCVLVAALAVASCAGQPINTPSGRPEVSIQGTTPDAVKGAIVGAMVNRGFRVSRDSQFQIAFDRPTKNMAAALLLGSRYDGMPNDRVTFDLAPTGGDVRVIAEYAVITNPGSAFERRTDLTGAGREEMDRIFSEVTATAAQPQAAAPVARSGKR